MKKIVRTALLPYSAHQVYDLVNDVNRYPEFLPWCGGAEVIAESETSMQAGVVIAKAGIKQKFVTNNHLVPGKRIEMHLQDGPFKYLKGEWQFKVLDKDACKIQFEIEFEFSNALLNMTVGPIFEQIASTMVDSFSQRAKQIYG